MCSPPVVPASARPGSPALPDSDRGVVAGPGVSIAPWQVAERLSSPGSADDPRAASRSCTGRAGPPAWEADGGSACDLRRMTDCGSAACAAIGRTAVGTSSSSPMSSCSLGGGTASGSAPAGAEPLTRDESFSAVPTFSFPVGTPLSVPSGTACSFPFGTPRRASERCASESSSPPGLTRSGRLPRRSPWSGRAGVDGSSDRSGFAAAEESASPLGDGASDRTAAGPGDGTDPGSAGASLPRPSASVPTPGRSSGDTAGSSCCSWLLRKAARRRPSSDFDRRRGSAGPLSCCSPNGLASLQSLSEAHLAEAHLAEARLGVGTGTGRAAPIGTGDSVARSAT